MQKIGKGLGGWKGTFRSHRGRLKQSVLSSLPTYFLSLFEIPSKIAKRIEKLLRDFSMGKFWRRREYAFGEMGNCQKI